MTNFIYPDWPAPDNVHAITTTRASGNIALHVDDNPTVVANNRNKLRTQLQLPNEPLWLQQVHGTTVLSSNHLTTDRRADGCYSPAAKQVCVVMTADCLPILITNTAGTEIAAIHGGWRGLAAGIMQQAVHKFTSPASELLVWLGPAIGQQAFEVGNEVRTAFINTDAELAAAFTPRKPGKWLCDLYCIARLQCLNLGIKQVFGGDFCTYHDDRFYSYRRGDRSGRMATLIWRNK